MSRSRLEEASTGLMLACEDILAHLPENQQRQIEGCQRAKAALAFIRGEADSIIWQWPVPSFGEVWHVYKLMSLNACQDFIEYAAQFSSLQAAWDKCRRGDWMLWLIGRQARKPDSAEQKKLVLVACKCARLALPYTTDKRVKNCVLVTAKYVNGNATIKELRAAAAAAAKAQGDAASETEAAAVVSAAAANASADPDHATSDAAFYAALYADVTLSCKQSAAVVRANYPKAPKLVDCVAMGKGEPTKFGQPQNAGRRKH